MSENKSDKLTRAEAARLNGAKSRGPKTEAGKAVSSRNAVKHGLTSVRFRDFLVRNENPDRFDAVYSSLVDVFRPANPLEDDLVRELAWARWCFHRHTAIEAGLLDAAMDHQADMLAQVCPDIHESTRLACAFTATADGSRSLDTLLRYAAQNRRAYTTALANLTDAQRRRLDNQKSDLPNEPSTSDLPGFFRSFRKPAPVPQPAPEDTGLLEPAASPARDESDTSASVIAPSEPLATPVAPAPSTEPAPAPQTRRLADDTSTVLGYLPRVTGTAPGHRTPRPRQNSRKMNTPAAHRSALAPRGPSVSDSCVVNTKAPGPPVRIASPRLPKPGPGQAVVCAPRELPAKGS